MALPKSNIFPFLFGVFLNWLLAFAKFLYRVGFLFFFIFFFIFSFIIALFFGWDFLGYFWIVITRRFIRIGRILWDFEVLFAYFI